MKARCGRFLPWNMATFSPNMPDMPASRQPFDRGADQHRKPRRSFVNWVAVGGLIGVAVGCRDVKADGFLASESLDCPSGFKVSGGRCYRSPPISPPASLSDGSIGTVSDNDGGVGASVDSRRDDSPDLRQPGSGPSPMPPPPVGDAAGAPASYTLTIRAEEGGRVSIYGQDEPCVDQCQRSFPAGTILSLSVVPDIDSSFKNWEEACGGSGACQITMDRDKSVTARFLARRWRAPDNARLYFITSGSNRAYVAGTFHGTLEIAGEMLVSVGESDVFVAALDPTLTPLWARRYGVAQGESIEGLTTGTDDERAVVVGAFQAQTPLTFAGATIEPDRSGSGYTSFLAVLSPAGFAESAYSGGGCNGLELDSQNNAIACQVSSFPSQLAKKTLTGQTLWSLSEQLPFSIRDMAVDPEDATIICGETQSPVRLTLPQGPTTVTPPRGGTGVVLVKVDPNGRPRWMTLLPVQRPAVDRYTACDSVSTDGQGDVYVAGYFDGTISAGSISSQTRGQEDAFVAKLAGGNGNPVWLQSFGSPGRDSGWVNVVESGDLLVSLVMAGDADLGGGRIIPRPGALVRISAADGTLMSRLLERDARVPQGMARDNFSGDYFIFDQFGLVRRASRLAPSNNLDPHGGSPLTI